MSIAPWQRWPIGRIALAASLAVALVAPAAYAAAQEAGELDGELPTEGMGTAVWGGGTVDLIVSAATDAGCSPVSIWVTIDGEFVGHIPGAPAFVNAAFAEAHPGLEVAAQTPVLLVCAPATGSTPQPTATPESTATPTATPQATETPAAAATYDVSVTLTAEATDDDVSTIEAYFQAFDPTATAATDESDPTTVVATVETDEADFCSEVETTLPALVEVEQVTCVAAEGVPGAE